MRCLYCDKNITKYSFTSLFFIDDYLCLDCRKKFIIDHKYVKINNLKIECLYKYDSLFKHVLMQYKECYDEALYKVFLYVFFDYIRFKYKGYKIVLVPSSKDKLNKRGFNHLRLIVEDLGLEIIDDVKMYSEINQEGKNYTQRQKALNNYYYDGKYIDNALIFDDVLTSGSSIIGVYNAIKPYSKNIKMLVLAN